MKKLLLVAALVLAACEPNVRPGTIFTTGPTPPLDPGPSCSLTQRQGDVMVLVCDGIDQGICTQTIPENASYTIYFDGLENEWYCQDSFLCYDEERSCSWVQTNPYCDIRNSACLPHRHGHRPHPCENGNHYGDKHCVNEVYGD